MKIGEVCNRNVVIIGPDETALKAARLMRAHHVGDVVVVEERGGRSVPIGIVTDRDLVVTLMARDVEPTSISARDMSNSRGIQTASTEEELLTVLHRMRLAGVRRMPVVDSTGALVGIITMDDMLELVAEQLDDVVGLISRGHQRESALRPV